MKQRNDMSTHDPHTSPLARFTGYSSPNYTPIPDQLLDEHLAFLSEKELKVLLYICRRTFGFKKDSDDISIDQMVNGITKRGGERLDYGTGLSRPSVTKAVQSLEAKRFIIKLCRRDAKRGDLSSTYTLNVGRSVAHTSVTTEQPTREEEGGVKNFNPSGEELKNFTRGVKNLNPQQTERQNTATTTNSLQKKNDAHSLQPANDNVVAALTSWGISQNVSKQLANRFSPTYIGEKIAFLEFLLKQEPARVKKPAAWLRSAIEDDYTAPDGFKTTAELERQANEEKERKQASVEAQKAYSDRSEQHWKEQEAERSARLQKLHHHYHTTQADFAFWGKAQTAMSAHGVSDVLIAYMQILKLEANQVIIHVRNHFMRQQLEKPKITQQIEAALHEVTDQPVELVFVVGDQIEEGSHEQ